MIPTSTDVSVQVRERVPGEAQAIALFVVEKGKSIPATAPLSAAERQAAQRLVDAGVALGKAREVIIETVDGPGETVRHLALVGLGDLEKATPETMRAAAGTMTKALRKRRIKSLAILAPGATGIELKAGEAAAAEALVSGVLLASFQYQEYKGAVARQKEAEEGPMKLALTVVAEPPDVPAVRAGVERARVVADAQNFARTIASRPGNDINPPSLAKVAQDLAKEVGVSCRVLDEKQLAKLGMGGLLAVGGGSERPPRLIVLEYRPGGHGKAKAPVAGRPILVVGKAITFDAGGISIKPADKMGRMIYDKSGGVMVLGLMYALAKLKLPVPVVGILSSAENTLSGRAYRPGDILRMYNGVTVEVTNTDAEGRLVLGDALAWGIETYRPRAVVDLATLTGGVVVALGHTMAGVMSNSDELVRQMQAAADRAGEKFWRLPLGEEHREQLKSAQADIVNSAGRDASPLQGGAFLSYFVPQDGTVPWVHVDIAGVADTEKELPYYAKGSTGWGLRMLVEWLGGLAGGARA